MPETPQSILEVKNFNTFVLIILTEKKKIPVLHFSLESTPGGYICKSDAERCLSWVVENEWTDCCHNATVIHAAEEACRYSQQIGQKAAWVVQNLSQSC